MIKPGDADQPSVFLRRPAQQARGKRRNHRNRHDDRNQHRHRDGDADIAEQLTNRQTEQQHRNEDNHRGQRRTEDGGPDLARAMISGGIGRKAALAKAEDILKRHDRGVDNHADGKGKTGK